jgi:hypothetical protein
MTPTAAGRDRPAGGGGWRACVVLAGSCCSRPERSSCRGSPAYDASLAEVRQFFTDHGTRFLVGDYIAGLGFLLFFLPFVVGLRSLLGAVEGGPQIGSRLVLVGGLATVLVGDTATVFQDALALGAGNPELQDTTVRAFLYANAAAIAAIGLPAALFTFAAAAVIWTTAVLWRWLAVVGALAGVLLAVGAAFPLGGDPTGPLWAIRFVGFIGLAVFVVAASIGMLRRTDQVAVEVGEQLVAP